MAKINLNNVTSPQNVSVMNDNFQKIMVALDEQVLYRDNPEGEPNQMENDLDMNGKRIYNLPEPVADSEPMRRQDAALIVNEVSGDLVAAAEAAQEAAENAQEAADEAIAALDGITASVNEAVSTANSAQSAVNATNTNIANNILPYVGKRTDEVVYAAAMDVTGSTVVTSILQAAINAAAAANKFLVLPVGTFLTGPLTCPTNFRGLLGAGIRQTTLRFVRQSYSAGQVMLNCSSNTASPEFKGFSLDTDDAVFKTAGVYVLVLNGTNYPTVDIRIVGRGEAGVFTNSMLGGRVNNLIVDCTGTAGNSFHAGFLGSNCNNVIVRGMRTTGLPTYSGVFGLGTTFSKFDSCHTEGTSGAFGYSLGGCAYSQIVNCTAKNTSHEAFQLTDCYYCSIENNTCEWETGFGVDAGISINGQVGTPGLTRFNKVTGNTVINAYACGLLCANNAQQNTFSNNKLKDCGVRGKASGATGTSYVAMGQYTDLASVVCAGNVFRDNEINSEVGPIEYFFAEFNNGAGSTLTDTRLIDNSLIGTATTGRYIFAHSSSSVWEIDGLTIPVTVAGTSGTPASSTGSMTFLRRGRDVVIQRLFISIPTATGASGQLTILWPGAPNSATNGGAIAGRDTFTGKGVSGVCNAGGAVITLDDAGSALVSGVNMVLRGGYLIP